MPDWNEIKKQYIKGGVTYSQLSKKFNVGLSALKQQAAKGKWTLLRDKANEITDLKTIEKVAKENSKYGEKLYKVADLLLDKLQTVINDNSYLNPQNIRHYTAALRDLKDIGHIKSAADIREQEARIARLQKEVDNNAESVNSVVQVEFTGGDNVEELSE